MTELLSIGQAVLARQAFSLMLGAELTALEPGCAILELAVRPEFQQQHGFVHGGVLSYLVDNAITFAGGSVLGEHVVTAEYKINYLKPARGERLIARAFVESAGSRLAVCRCEVIVLNGSKEIRCTVGQGTIAVLEPTAY
jgi:uncharacterized protein (TIGR00369 family)